MPNEEKKTLSPFELSHIKIFLQAASVGVQAAIEDHKRLQQSVVVWQNGEVVELQPEEIPEFLRETEKTETKE
jgi:hypothetical protein